MSTTSAPDSWGANNPGPYSVVVRTGGYFLLYGHLRSIDPSIYLGARVGPGAALGELVYQPDTAGMNNTHLHLEVRTFRPEQMNYLSLADQYEPISCEYGKVIKDAQQDTTIPKHPKPGFVTDPMYFVPSTMRGSSTVSGGVRTYTEANLKFNDEPLLFSYRVLEVLNLKSMDVAPDHFPATSPSPVAPTAPSC